MGPFREKSGKFPKSGPTRPGYPVITAPLLAPGAKPGPESTPPRNSLPGDALKIPFGAVRGPIRPGTLLWAGHGPMGPEPFLPKPRAHGPRTPPGQAKPLWALIGNWYRNRDRDRHMDRDRHGPCIQFLELVPKGKWARARARAKRARAKRARAKRARAKWARAKWVGQTGQSQMGRPNGPGPNGAAKRAWAKCDPCPIVQQFGSQTTSSK